MFVTTLRSAFLVDVVLTLMLFFFDFLPIFDGLVLGEPFCLFRV